MNRTFVHIRNLHRFTSVQNQSFVWNEALRYVKLYYWKYLFLLNKDTLLFSNIKCFSFYCKKYMYTWSRVDDFKTSKLCNAWYTCIWYKWNSIWNNYMYYQFLTNYMHSMPLNVDTKHEWIICKDNKYIHLYQRSYIHSLITSSSFSNCISWSSMIILRVKVTGQQYLHTNSQLLFTWDHYQLGKTL